MMREAPPVLPGGSMAGLAVDERMPILIVDDREENLKALEAVLAPVGYPLVRATSGKDALRLLLERDFALVLLDVRMPGIDGLETARLIKGRERTSELPIVFLTAAREDVAGILRGYGVGAIDYVLKPFDPELLRSKVAVFAELEHSRRALRRSEAFLLAAFEAAPIGKTVLDSERRIVRANPAFARMVGSTPEQLAGIEIAELCAPADREALSDLLDQVGAEDAGVPPADDEAGIDLRLHGLNGRETWVAPTASIIESSELAVSLRLIQWVDVGARRRAEVARAELMLEQAARAHAEAEADHLEKLRQLGEGVESVTVAELVPELTERLRAVFSARAAEIQLDEHAESAGIAVARARAGTRDPDGRWQEAAVTADGMVIGAVRVQPGDGRLLTAAEQALLRDAAEHFSLLIRRVALQHREHQIAVELQRGLMPARLPTVPGVEIAAHYQAAGVGAEVGGDWYDAFTFRDGRLGVVVGDVTGSGIRAASTMGQLRSVTRAFALGDETPPSPAEVLIRLRHYQQTLDSEAMFTLLYLVLDPAAGTVTWANAGHLPPLLRAAGRVQVLQGTDTMLSVGSAEYHDRHALVREGDTLILYTDGLVERRDEAIDAGIGRLAAALAGGPQEPDALCAHILKARPGPGAQPEDDVTAVVLHLVARDRGQLRAADGSRQAGGLEVALPATAQAPGQARRALERTFAEILEPEELERAQLAVSEIVTNSVRHGQGPIVLRAEMTEARLLVEVVDHGPGFEYLPRAVDDAEVGGWGLSIVAAETSRWGLREGALVWFEIDRDPVRSPAGIV
jgi:PAS domain S-box-containing protein